MRGTHRQPSDRWSLARLTGDHLHNQIVVPLIAASVVVGVVATILAVVTLSRLMDAWIDSDAESIAGNMSARVQTSADDLARFTRFAAQNPELDDAIREGDKGRIAGLLARANASLQFDNVMLLDEQQRVVAVTGKFSSLIDPRPFGSRGDVLSSMGHPTLMRVGSHYTITAVAPVRAFSDPKVYTLAVSTVLDDRFLADIGAESGTALCLYDEQANEVACSTPASTALRRVLSDSPSVRKAVLNTSRHAGSGHATFRVDGVGYRLGVAKVGLEGDPKRAVAYIAATVGTNITANTRVTTTALIFMWSVVAVLVLIILGFMVARNVTVPLLHLTEGARAVADGDFSAKVEVTGENELAELADTFNLMTDSLRERTDSLTKKVLELATLYEMSRALGSTLDMDILLESVLDSALRIFDVDLGYVTLRDREAGTLQIRASRGRGRGDEQAVRSSMADWVIREGRPLIFNPSTGNEPERVDSITGAHAALCVPLMSGDGVIGAITVGSGNGDFRFSSDDVRLLATMANHVTIAIGNIELFSSLQDAYLATVRSLAAAVDAKDSYTRGHSDNVAQYAMMIAQQLGLSSEQRIALEMAAYLHDIGKIGIREEILLKPGRLTDAEYLQMKHHPLIGANILRPVAFPWPIAPVVRHHHEHYDGSGYPAGLKGEEIPLLARILTVADAFEAMISDRPYRKGRSVEEASAELMRCRGRHFDPRIVDAFVAALESRDTEESRERAIGGVQSEEARAVLVAVCDGMFAAFRKLGGPRLAANLEDDFAEFLVGESLPYRFDAGHLAVQHGRDDANELDDMRRIIAKLASLMERTTGRSLVDHFYAETLEGLSERLAGIARLLDLHRAAA